MFRPRFSLLTAPALLALLLMPDTGAAQFLRGRFSGGRFYGGYPYGYRGG